MRTKIQDAHVGVIGAAVLLLIRETAVSSLYIDFQGHIAGIVLL